MCNQGAAERPDSLQLYRQHTDGLNDSCPHKILDLSELTLVDLEVVRFLISVEDEGVELYQCPPYVREWMLRERAEGAQPESSNAT